MAEVWIMPFQELGLNDVPIVGGKNASLGEMIRTLGSKSIQVPNGFATTTDAYHAFIEHNHLKDTIRQAILKYKAEEVDLENTGKYIRSLFLNTQFPDAFVEAVTQAYHQLCDDYKTPNLDVAVRSSATAEDLPDASFAGQQETFLNISGVGAVLDSIRRCFASLFTDRAIYYREEKNFSHLEVALSVGVQKMVRSDLASSGVLFTLDTETGFPDVIVITGSWGLGECVVQGMVTPDEFIVSKPQLQDPQFAPIISKKLGRKHQKMVYAEGSLGRTAIIDTSYEEKYFYSLSDSDVLTLARWAADIETHYQKPMDIEWAKDGKTGELFIVQARPETVQSRNQSELLKTYQLTEKGTPLIEGLSIGDAIATGRICLIEDVEDIKDFIPGSILVTEMTDPDWVPIMGQAAGIVTNQGGRTCHAAIVSRELGVPAIVGTGSATRILEDKAEVTLSCAEGDMGFVYPGILAYETNETPLENIPETQTDIMLNIANPDIAFRWWRLPSKGVGLARMEFIINNAIKIHPMALVNFETLNDPDLIHQIKSMTPGYDDKKEFFVSQLAYGIGKIAAAQYPHPVILRMSDFKSNEYANLIGGHLYEKSEENPMLGFRGASRYYSDAYRAGFALECQAVKRVRDKMGLQNLKIMIPFCRTLTEADKVFEELEANGLRRGENGLEIYVMCEIPANVILAEAFAQKFDGFSIGSNDLTQLVLGVDRDSAALADIFDERNAAVKMMIQDVITKAKKHGKKVGICGQGPSDFPDFALFLVQAGIDSMSLNPDSFIQVAQRVAEFESQNQ